MDFLCLHRNQSVQSHKTKALHIVDPYPIHKKLRIMERIPLKSVSAGSVYTYLASGCNSYALGGGGGLGEVTEGLPMRIKLLHSTTIYPIA